METKGWDIWRYESVLVADLVAIYLLKANNTQLKEVLWIGIYRYDGFFVFKGNRSISDILSQRDKCQEKVDNISGKDYLQVTCETCNINGH